VGGEAIYLATVWVLPVIIAITFHEAAHGFVAHLLGDDTAWRLGRLRLCGPCGAQDEFTLAAIAQNLRRLAKLVARPPPAIAGCVA
jgi:hypothetical protein